MDCDPQLTARARERRVPPHARVFLEGGEVVVVGSGVQRQTAATGAGSAVSACFHCTGWC